MFAIKEIRKNAFGIMVFRKRLDRAMTLKWYNFKLKDGNYFCKLPIVILMTFIVSIGNAWAVDNVITVPQIVFLGSHPEADDSKLKSSLGKQIEALKIRFSEENVVFRSVGHPDFRLDSFEVTITRRTNMPKLKAKYENKSLKSMSEPIGKCRNCSDSLAPEIIAAALVDDLVNHTLLNKDTGIFPPLKVKDCQYNKKASYVQEVGIVADWGVRAVENDFTYELREEQGRFNFSGNVYLEVDQTVEPKRYADDKGWVIQFRLLQSQTNEAKEFIQNCSDNIQDKKYRLYLRSGIPEFGMQGGSKLGTDAPSLSN